MKPKTIYEVIKAPVITDKAYRLADSHRTFVFNVAKDSDKLQIKRTVETLFDVKVQSVRVTNQKGKARKFGRILGRTKAWKKAYVRLAEGYDLDFGGEVSTSN